jgi:hypothetical protein
VFPYAGCSRIWNWPLAPCLNAYAMAMAAAPYLHPRLTAIDAKLSPAVAQPSPQKLLLEFVLPTRDHAREDQE